ncbi:hypothetical protein PRJ39_25265 [Lysobacter enzymogenes]|uniref:hypothetical protein n=1 Tax=Lysobacter enzymogenes TaxID=69 RepID=UPI003748DFD9
MNTPTPPAAAKRAIDLGFFWFLVDAPMYVDSPLIERFHDAVIRPDNIVVSEAESTGSKEETQRKLGVQGKGKGEIPFVVGLALKGSFDHRFKRENTAALTRQLDIPRTSERLLEDVVAFYLAHFPERVLRVDPIAKTVATAVADSPAGYDTLNKTCETLGPRPIVLIDAPRGTKIMPMAGEFKDGKIDVIYDALIAALSTADNPLKRFDRKMDAAKKAERWGELVSRFDARIAMSVLEEAGLKHDGARFEWIDFRMAWGEDGSPSPLHLHVVPNGNYSMGTFAHAFIRRGYGNGVRIVGTLKTGGDVNVLAIYER